MMRESKIINYRPIFRSPFYPWIQILAIVAYIFLIFQMGRIPLIISFSFVGISLLWFFISARKIKRQSALMHLVQRVTARELVDTSLEDELRDIIHKRDKVTKDRFDHLIEECEVHDIEEEMTRDELFAFIATRLAKRLKLEPSTLKKLLIKREEESHTVIDKGLAIPHIIVPGEGKFQVIMARSQKGIAFDPGEEPVHIIFVLAGTMDERNFHLRVLMAIAQIVREPHFYKDWVRMRDPEALRGLVLSSTRKRGL